jgi:sulfoxide reductase heme-binding subunit YedZ
LTAAKALPSPLVPRGVFALACVPALWLAGRALLGGLGANPFSELLNQLGLFTLILLFSSLSCTPLQLALGWKWPLRVRRMLGLFAFFYACSHLSTYLLDQGFDFGEIGKDILKRKFITIGMATWLCLLPLAVTSTNGWMRRLGFKRWKLLHRLAYAAGVLGVIHFIWRVKKDLTEPLVYAAVLAVLLGVRGVHFARLAIKARADRATVAP